MTSKTKTYTKKTHTKTLEILTHALKHCNRLFEQTEIDYRNRNIRNTMQFWNYKICSDTLLGFCANTCHIDRALYNWILPGFVFIQIDITMQRSFMPLHV